MTCAVDGCHRQTTARGWCNLHYQRWRRSGTTDAPTEWSPGLPGNPWAGRRLCPECGSHRWTMPSHGHWDDSHWVCVARQHTTVFFTFRQQAA
jgi:hypothetical protein